MENKEKITNQKEFKIGNYLKNYKTPIFFYILFSLIACGCSVFTTILMAQAIENITLSSYQIATYLLLITLGITLLRRFLNYLLNYIYLKYSTMIMSDLSKDLAKQAFKLNSKTYSDHGTGTFVQRIVSDPSSIINQLTYIVDIIFQLVYSFIIIVYISFLNFYIGLSIALVIILSMIVEMKRIKVRRINYRKVRNSYDKINSLTTEIVRSEKDIKSLGLENSLADESSKYYDEYKNIFFKSGLTDQNWSTIRNLIIEIFGVGVLILGIYLINLGLITLATFIIINSYKGDIAYFSRAVGQLLDCFTLIKISKERMYALFDNDEFVCEKFGNKSLKRIKGKIEFKNVCYTFYEYEYPQNTKDKKKTDTPKKKIVSSNQIFKNLSFSIEPNTTVAFVGKSGSGKSTILNLMSKMYEADSGEVLIDNVNINDLDKTSLRKAISLVNQFPYIFDMTIKENLLLAKESASDKQIMNAIKKSSLKEFIDTLPKGIDTKVGESGIKLSGGQKQRLAIARALLRNSPIIIFDESTSSLDNFAQEEVKKSIDALKGHSTIVIVAHRLSTIKNVDKIFFLDNGVIQDSGTFEELFKRNKNFKAMFLVENI